LRNGELPSWNELNTICRLIDKQVGDLVEYVPDEE
jgi:DNA-binding Xre family transcriptional regulator